MEDVPEKNEYKLEQENYIIYLSFDSNEIIFNLKSSILYQFDEFESKFNYSDLKQINQFFAQFSDMEKIGNIFIKLLKEKKITISESQNSIKFSFININDEAVNLSIIKKKLDDNKKYEKLSERVKNVIKEVKHIKEEKKEINEENNEMKRE